MRLHHGQRSAKAFGGDKGVWTGMMLLHLPPLVVKGTKVIFCQTRHHELYSLPGGG